MYLFTHSVYYSNYLCNFVLVYQGYKVLQKYKKIKCAEVLLINCETRSGRRRQCQGYSKSFPWFCQGELKVSVVFLFIILEEIHNQHRFKLLHFYKNVCYPAKDIYCNTLNYWHTNYVTQVSNGWILTFIFINWFNI